jgi:hypothetical protein
MNRPFKNAAVAEVFAAYPPGVRTKLLALRELIFATAARTTGVGRVDEVLKWQQPSYVTVATGSGSTIRIDATRTAREYAVYFHCQTSLVETFRRRYGRLFRYEGNRALLFSCAHSLPQAELSDCIAAALTYHLAKRKLRIPIGQLIR